MSNDLISRQAAIDALDALCDRECEYSKKQRSVMCGACHLGSAFDVVEQLPSAQPEPHYCRECKWSRCHINVDKHGKSETYWRCLNWDGGTDEEGYCYEWEKRTDE